MRSEWPADVPTADFVRRRDSSQPAVYGAGRDIFSNAKQPTPSLRLSPFSFASPADRTFAAIWMMYSPTWSVDFPSNSRPLRRLRHRPLPTRPPSRYCSGRVRDPANLWPSRVCGDNPGTSNSLPVSVTVNRFRSASCARPLHFGDALDFLDNLDLNQRGFAAASRSMFRVSTSHSGLSS